MEQYQFKTLESYKEHYTEEFRDILQQKNGDEKELKYNLLEIKELLDSENYLEEYKALQYLCSRYDFMNEEFDGDILEKSICMIIKQKITVHHVYLAIYIKFYREIKLGFLLDSNQFWYFNNFDKLINIDVLEITLMLWDILFCCCPEYLENIMKKDRLICNMYQLIIHYLETKNNDTIQPNMETKQILIVERLTKTLGEFKTNNYYVIEIIKLAIDRFSVRLKDDDDDDDDESLPYIIVQMINLFYHQIYQYDDNLVIDLVIKEWLVETLLSTSVSKLTIIEQLCESTEICKMNHETFFYEELFDMIVFKLQKSSNNQISINVIKYLDRELKKGVLGNERFLNFVFDIDKHLPITTTTTTTNEISIGNLHWKIYMIIQLTQFTNKHNYRLLIEKGYVSLLLYLYKFQLHLGLVKKMIRSINLLKDEILEDDQINCLQRSYMFKLEKSIQENAIIKPLIDNKETCELKTRKKIKTNENL